MKLNFSPFAPIGSSIKQPGTISNKMNPNTDYMTISIFFIAFAVAGAVLITINKGAVIGRAFIVSVIIGIIVVVIRRAVAMAKLKFKTKYQELYLTDYFIVLNGEKYQLFGEGIYTSSVRLIDNQAPIILEFKINWKTRNGVTFDELRLPVPPAEIAKANNFCSNFTSKHALNEK